MSVERVGLVLRGTLLKTLSREVRPKTSEAFTRYEARILADANVHIVTFYTAAEMEAALRGHKAGEAVELPVYTRAWNQIVYLHYRRPEQVTDEAA